MPGSVEVFGTGSREGYEWAVSERVMNDLFRVCPEVTIGKFAAVTAVDSAPMRLSEQQKDFGWTTEGGIAYSPRIADTDSVPQDYFSEFYVFSEPVNLGALVERNPFESGVHQNQIYAFVNYDFGLQDPDYKSVTELFWQLAWIKPESYVAENDYLTFVTRSRVAFVSVCDALRKLG